MPALPKRPGLPENKQDACAELCLIEIDKGDKKKFS